MNTITRRSALMYSMLLGLSVLAGCKNEERLDGTATEGEKTESANTESEESLSQSLGIGDPFSKEHDLCYATIYMENGDTIKLELDETVAPISVKNFCKLASKGFYDGLTFHRIIKDFMIQGGDPEGNGTGGSDTPIEGEFSLNGHENAISHVRGVISMARNADYNSASSQFFIVHQDSTFLDGQYAAFGRVIEGMDVVDELAETPVLDVNGTVAPDNQPVISRIVVDE